MNLTALLTDCQAKVAHKFNRLNTFSLISAKRPILKDMDIFILVVKAVILLRPLFFLTSKAV